MAKNVDALVTAASEGRLDEIQRLLGRGVPVDGRDQDGVTALFGAATCGEEGAVQALLAAGADAGLVADEETGETPLHAAAIGGHASLVRTLLEAGAPVDAALTSEEDSDRGRTPLMHACCATGGDASATLDALLAAGADPNASDARGRTALFHLADSARARFAAAGLAGLVGGNGDGDAGSGGLGDLIGGLVNLAQGVERSGDAQDDASLPLAERLLAAGADPSRRDAEGETPAELAARRGQDALAARLRSALG